MFNFSLRAIKILAFQPHCKNIFCCYNFVNFNLAVAYARVASGKTLNGEALFHQDSDESKTLAVYNLHRQSGEINWHEITKKLEDLKIKSIPTALFHVFDSKKDVDSAISYYNYVVQNNVSVNVFDLMRFFKVILELKDKCGEYEGLVTEIYDKLKDYMSESSVIQHFFVNMISQSPKCFSDFLNLLVKKPSLKTSQNVIKAALQLNMIEVVPKLYNADLLQNAIVNKTYLETLIRLAQSNQFSPHLITDYIELCSKHGSYIVCSNLSDLMKQLGSVVTKNSKNYNMIVNLCQVDHDSVCSRCGLKLLPKPLSESEFRELQDKFLTDVIFHRKPYLLSTTEEELDNFLKFLNTCGPYNLVLDALNLIYQRRVLGPQNHQRFVKYFVKRGFKVLVIGRIHSKNQTQSGLEKLIRSKQVQFFFANNDTDDDLFFLYSALKNGPETYILSGDHLLKYAARFDDNLKPLFTKWKKYHQYIIKDNELIPPQPHLGLPQLTKCDPKNNEFTWHISYSAVSSGSLKIHNTDSLKWMCVTAKKKVMNAPNINK